MEKTPVDKIRELGANYWPPMVTIDCHINNFKIIHFLRDI